MQLQGVISNCFFEFTRGLFSRGGGSKSSRVPICIYIF